MAARYIGMAIFVGVECGDTAYIATRWDGDRRCGEIALAIVHKQQKRVLAVTRMTEEIGSAVAIEIAYKQVISAKRIRGVLEIDLS